MTTENNNNQVTTTLTSLPLEGGNLRKGGEVVSPSPKKTGRPTKLTPELQEKICKYVANGNYFTTACQAVGIDYKTFTNWQQKGEEEANNGGGLYFRFFQALKRAEAAAEANMLERLRLAAEPGERKRVIKENPDGTITTEITETGGDWLAAATFLERRYRERWGRPAPVGITIDEHKEISITHVEYHLGPGQALPQIIEGEARELEDEK